MNFPDAPTLVLLVGLLYLVLPAFTWVVLKPHHTIQVSLWCGGGLLIGTGAVLAAATSHETSPVWTSLVTLLFTSSYCLRIQALRLDLDVAWSTQRMVWLGGGLFLLVIVISYGMGLAVLGTQINNTIQMGLFLHVAGTAWKISQVEKSRSAQSIAIVYALLGFAFFYRAIAFSGELAEPSVVTSQLETLLVAFFGMLSASIGHFGYIGLQLERAQRREVQSQEVQVRHDTARRLNAKIAHLERQRILNEMSASLTREIAVPISAIAMEVKLAQRDIDAACCDSSTLAARMQQVIGFTGQAVAMIERIRAFIRPSLSDSVAVDLNPITQDAIQLVVGEARSRGIQIHTNLYEQPVLVRGNGSEIAQVTLSLLRNAMDVLDQRTSKYILVSTASQGDSVLLRVQDGHPAMDSHRKPAARHAAHSKRATRMGMALVMARTIAAQYGATLRVIPPQANGNGAMAEVRFPAVPVSASNQLVAHQLETKGRSTCTTLMCER